MKNINKEDINGYLDYVALEINSLGVRGITISHILSTLELGDFSRYRFTYLHFMAKLILWWLQSDVYASNVTDPYISLYIEKSRVDEAVDEARGSNSDLLSFQECHIAYTRDDYTELSKLITPDKVSHILDCYNKRFAELDARVSKRYDKDVDYLLNWARLKGDINTTSTSLRGYVVVRDAGEWREVWGW